MIIPGGDASVFGNYHLDNVFFSDPKEYDELYLLQMGRLYCTGTTVVEAHIHTDLFELTVVTDGAGQVSTNGVPTTVSAGDIYLSLPGDIHKIVSDEDRPLKYDFWAFRPKEGPYGRTLSRIAEEHHAPEGRVFRDGTVRQLVAQAIAELNEPDLYSEELLNAMFRQICIRLLRDLQNTPKAPYPGNATNAEVLCYRLMDQIDTHIYTMKSLTELCESTGYSYGYLSTVFRQHTGETLHDYYNARRGEAARLLLGEGRLSVTEIAETLGYSSLYAFSKAFKQRYREAPKHYQMRMKAQP